MIKDQNFPIKRKAGHIQFSLDGLARLLTPSMLPGLKRPDGTGPATVEEAISELNEMRAEGYTMVPCGCPEAQKAPGECPGWDPSVDADRGVQS